MALRTRRTRRQNPGKFKLHKPRWIDPFPQIEGTEPEKRVFAALVQMGIYFKFPSQVPEFEHGHPMYFLAPLQYKPDFVLPEYRLIIDPFSPFHHSLPEAVNRDIDKIAKYSAIGYAYYHPWAIGAGVWSWDQDAVNLNSQIKGFRHRDKYPQARRALHQRAMGTSDMLAMIPELHMGARYPLTDPRDIAAKRAPGYFIGEFLGAGANSVAAANHKRRKPKSLSVKVGARKTIRRAR